MELFPPPHPHPHSPWFLVITQREVIRSWLDLGHSNEACLSSSIHTRDACFTLQHDSGSLLSKATYSLDALFATPFVLHPEYTKLMVSVMLHNKDFISFLASNIDGYVCDLIHSRTV